MISKNCFCCTNKNTRGTKLKTKHHVELYTRTIRWNKDQR